VHVKRSNTHVDVLNVQENKVKVLTRTNLRAAMDKLVPNIAYKQRDKVKELCTKIVEAMRTRQVVDIKKRKRESEIGGGGGGGRLGGGGSANNGGGGGSGPVSGDGVGGGGGGGNTLKSPQEKTRKLDPSPTSQPSDPEVRRVDTSVRMISTCLALHFNQTVLKIYDLSSHFTIHARICVSI